MISSKEQFVLALRGKTYQGTLTNWYWQGCDIRGQYKGTNGWVAYSSEYIEQMIDDRILVFENEGYVLLENKSG